MLNNEVFMSPESVFYDYQRKMEKQLCQVCQNLAVGFHYGAYVCEACKKFFKRYMFNHSVDTTACKVECDIERVGRRKCADCRFKKCLRVGMRLTASNSGKTDFDISKIPCRICGSKSSGFHFGSLTCEGCKGFFRRADMLKDRLVCSSKRNCFINFSNRAMCKYCRYQQCLKVGMSKSGSRIGRQPNAVKHHCVMEITNCNGKTAGTSETTYATSEYSQSDSLSDDIMKSIVKDPSIFNGYQSNNGGTAILSKIQEPQLNIFYNKIMEAMGILQMPFREAMARLQIIRNPLYKNQNVVEVWTTMMQHFDVHSHMLIQFAKRIPIFNDLSLVDRRLLVQESMYPIILLNLARSYSPSDNQFNYFDFTVPEYEGILVHFPCMHIIMSHVMNISRVVNNLRLTNKQVGFFCVMELFKNFSQLESSAKVNVFYQHAIKLCWASIIDLFMNTEYSSRVKMSDSDILSCLRTLNCPLDLIDTIVTKVALSNSAVCLQNLRVIFHYLGQWLQKYNIEHQAIIDKLKNNNPELPYSELYTEMFQLTSTL